MKFRKWFFLFLALLSAAWLVYGYAMGAFAGFSLWRLLILCTGVPGVIVFSLLAWRA